MLSCTACMLNCTLRRARHRRHRVPCWRCLNTRAAPHAAQCCGSLLMLQVRPTPVPPAATLRPLMHRFPLCRVCGAGDLVPLSDYSSEGASVAVKVWQPEAFNP